MTAHTPSPEQLAALPCCRDTAAAKGLNARYLADAAIRHYRGRPLADLLHDLGGVAATEVTISGGMGTLIMRPLGNQFLRAAGTEPRPHTKVSPDVAAKRVATCRACAHYRPAADTCGLCGCASVVSQKTQSAFGSCPEGKWDAQAP